MSDDLRDCLAAALAATCRLHQLPDHGGCQACDKRLAAVLGVVEPELDRLTKRIEEYRASRERWQAAVYANQQGSSAAQRSFIALTIQVEHLNQRLARIAQAHSKNQAPAGMTSGDCDECDFQWPCPTYVWATTARDPLACWDPQMDWMDTDD